MFVLKQANIACRQHMTAVNLLEKHLKTTFLLYSFKLVLYLDTTAISNQIKYYLTANRGNFLKMQYGFYRYALLADLRWFVVERAFSENSTKTRT